MRQPFGPYVLRRKLAEGGMAEIFLARRAGGGEAARDIVLKRLRGSLAAPAEALELFRQEGRLAARLIHPHLVRVYEQGEAEGRAYLAMEWLCGEDFSTLVRLASQRGEYMPVPLVLRVLADAARGLHHAHEAVDATGRPLNIVHRDVSPANLYVTFQGEVKVLDFGVAQVGGAATRPGEMKGKVIYMAPEQALGGAVDRRADVFSLGVSLYEALTHVRPFARERDAAVLDALRAGDFPPPRTLRPELSPALEEVVLRALSPEPARRHASAAEFADALERTLASDRRPATPAQLAEYVRESVGQARYREKSFVPPFVAPSGTGGGAQWVPSPLSVSPSPSRAPGRSWRRWAVGALLLVGLGGAGAGAVFLEKGPESTAVPRPVASARAPGPGAAGVAVARTEALLPPREETVAPEVAGREEAQAPASLEVADIQRVVVRHRARYLPCFEKHKQDLPADEGEVRVRFVVQPTGRARMSIEGPLAERPLGRCLRQRLARLRFPTHRGDAVTVGVPLGYRVTR